MKKLATIATSLFLTVSLAFYVPILPRQTKYHSVQTTEARISTHSTSISIDTKQLLLSLVRQVRVKLAEISDR